MLWCQWLSLPLNTTDDGLPFLSAGVGSGPPLRHNPALGYLQAGY